MWILCKLYLWCCELSWWFKRQTDSVFFQRKTENIGMFILCECQRLYFMSYCMFYVSVCIDFYRHKLALMSLFQSYTRNLSSFMVMFFVIFCVCEEISSRKFLSTSVFYCVPSRYWLCLLRVFVLILSVVLVWNCAWIHHKCFEFWWAPKVRVKMR